MLRKLLRVVGPVFLGVGMTLAQDPTKVEPTHYKLAFENEWVQVVNVHYGPHEKSRMHEHPGGVVVVLTDAHLKFTDPSGKTQEIYAKPGESRWFQPFKHEVENLGDTVYNAVYVGVKAKAGSAKSKTRGAYSGSDPRTQSSTLSARNQALPRRILCYQGVRSHRSRSFTRSSVLFGQCQINCRNQAITLIDSGTMRTDTFVSLQQQ